MDRISAVLRALLLGEVRAKSGHSERTDTTPGSRPANTPAKAWMRPRQNDADRALYYPFGDQPPFDG